MNKEVKTNVNFTKEKCLKCQNYDKKNDCCKIEENNCNVTDFSKCNDYLLHEKFVMF